MERKQSAESQKFRLCPTLSHPFWTKVMRNAGSELRTDLILGYSVEVSGGLLERVLLVPPTLAFPVEFVLSVEFLLSLT